MNVIHIITNYVLIFGHGPIPSLGVLGVSISTWLSKLVGLMIIGYTFKKLLTLKVSFTFLKPFPWHTIKSLLHISVPSGGETLSYQLSQTMIMKNGQYFGTRSNQYKGICIRYCYALLCIYNSTRQCFTGNRWILDGGQTPRGGK